MYGHNFDSLEEGVTPCHNYFFYFCTNICGRLSEIYTPIQYVRGALMILPPFLFFILENMFDLILLIQTSRCESLGSENIKMFSLE